MRARHAMPGSDERMHACHRVCVRRGAETSRGCVHATCGVCCLVTADYSAVCHRAQRGVHSHAQPPAVGLVGLLAILARNWTRFESPYLSQTTLDNKHTARQHQAMPSARRADPRSIPANCNGPNCCCLSGLSRSMSQLNHFIACTMVRTRGSRSPYLTRTYCSVH